MNGSTLNEIVDQLSGSVLVENNAVRVINPDRLRNHAYRLAEWSSLESGARQGWAQYLTRKAAQAVGIYPASIHELYLARGKGDVPLSFTVPAMNLRVLPYDAARAVFRAALNMDAAALIFELSRSEMAYTNQRPNEYVSSILAAAISEGYRGPVFIQGDHFQVSAKHYGVDPDAELSALKQLIQEALAAGFFNIDIDASTLVDLTKLDVTAQQTINTQLTAMFTHYLRSVEPEGVTVSVGGEIGEVGGHNSTEEELRAFLDGFKRDLGQAGGDLPGLSKISIQTGTSHGGVVLPDGSIAEVNVDFNTMRHLSRIARDDYGMGGAVQHGASTLPENAFEKFVEAEACEIHLATNFMNMYFEHIPTGLRAEIYTYLRENHAADRTSEMTDEQFNYKIRKQVVGAFKEQSWKMDPSIRDELGQAWEAQFKKLFRQLGLEGTRSMVERIVHQVDVAVDPKDYLGEAAGRENVADLAD